MEETNPNAVIDETNFDDIFEDSEDFEEQETKETEEQPTEEEPAEPNQPAVEELVTLKYMGKEIPVPQGEINDVAARLGVAAEDIPTLIQKGMNYDRAVENTPLHKTVARLAEANGMTVTDYQQFLENAFQKLAYDREMEKAVAENPNATPDVLDKLVKKELDNRNLKSYKNQIEQTVAEAKQAAQSEAAQLAPYRAFHEKYPDVTAFPEEVASEIKNYGVDPTYAYEMYLQRQAQQDQIKNMEAELNSLKQKDKNYYSSVGSAKSTAAEEADDFLAGWDS